MKIRNAGIMLFFAVFCLSFAGCGGRSPATMYYAMQSDISAPGTSNLSGNKEVALYKVDIPAYLDRNSIVSRDPDGVRLSIAEYHQWAEPVDRGVRRVLSETLAPVVLGNGGVLLASNDSTSSASIRVYVDIQRLDGTLNGDAVLSASFTVRDRDEKVLSRGLFSESEAAGQTYDSMVAAESRLLVKFGKSMAPRILSAMGVKSAKR